MRNNSIRKTVVSAAMLWLPFLVFMPLLTSCETDSYEKGEGEYSLMQADLCELNVNGQKQATSFVTDDGNQYTLKTPYTAQWIESVDTTYRTLIYYNKVDASQAEVMGIGSIPTLYPIAHWKFKELRQDPVDIESAWMAKSGKYLNLGVLIKTGRIDDEEQPHTIGLAQDTVLVHPDGKRTAYYRFLHSQNDIPEYYTNRRYVSILIPNKQRPDTICLTVKTYQGTFERVFVP